MKYTDKEFLKRLEGLNEELLISAVTFNQSVKVQAVGLYISDIKEVILIASEILNIVVDKMENEKWNKTNH